MKNRATTKREFAHSPAGTVTVEPIDHLELYWQDSGNPLKWDCLFMLPPWLGTWWSYFGKGPETQLYVVRKENAVLGLAPLTVRGDTARLISDSDLIDYSDVIVAPSGEREFLSTLFDHFRREGISRFDTGRVRADSTTVSCLKTYSGSIGSDISCAPVDVLYEMDLPDQWEGYLVSLSGKERHETRRKIRRLESAGYVGLRTIEDERDVSYAIETFLALFRSNREEKALFMTGDVKSFFRSLALAMAKSGLLTLYVLDVNDTPIAAAMCFDYRSTVYLYNNGYDRHFDYLSGGILTTVFSIRESIKRNRKRYNFLRGTETYKGRLGGRPLKLLQCEVTLR
ncbi:MAG TPA: GNAT family N-acetyltransferase [Thermodesulfovibrionales bacterium]|nr:GNAT family N-acetyltransferase [Thermodesulfovibrionales bacterium]